MDFFALIVEKLRIICYNYDYGVRAVFCCALLPLDSKK